MNKKGHSLVDSIIVVTIVVILLSLMLATLNPLEKVRIFQDSKRYNDINALINTLIQYQTDNSGDHYQNILDLESQKYYMIGTCESSGDIGCRAKTTESKCVDISEVIKAPKAPSGGTAEKTLYYLMKWEEGALTIGACDTGVEDKIEMTR